MALIFFVYNGGFCLTLAIIPLSGTIFLRMVKYNMDKSLKECQSIVDFVIFFEKNSHLSLKYIQFTIGFKLYLLIQCLTIFCKFDTFLTWAWSEVFWPFWVLFSILIGVNFGMIFMFLSRFCQMLFSSINLVECNFYSFF